MNISVTLEWVEGEYDEFDDYSAHYLWLCWAVTRGIQIYKNNPDRLLNGDPDLDEAIREMTS